MSEKVYMVPDAVTSTGNNVDPNLLLSMMNNGGGMGNGNWLWVIFLFFLYGWNRNGLFGSNESSTLGSTTEREMLLQAINGNGTAISTLASTLNSDFNSVQTAISSVLTAISSVGNQLGLTGQQVINAVQQGNTTLAQQICSCCCENKMLVQQMGYEGQLRDATNTAAITSRIDQLSNGVQTGFASTAYETLSQTNALKEIACANTQTIVDKISQLQTSALQDKISELQETKSTLQNQISQEQLNQAIAAMIAPLQAQINAVKASQPNTVAVQYPQLSVYPSYLPYLYGSSNAGGFWN